MKKKLNLLGELIEDFQGVKTKSTLVKKLADYMHRNFKAAAVEMAWNIGASNTVLSVTRNNDSYDFKSTGRDINQSAFSEVLASGQALVSEVQEETDDNLFIEERIAIELYATQLVILPLYDNDDINGFLSIYLLEEQDLAGLSELLQHLLTTVTLLLKQVSLIEKLSQVSRKAFKKIRAYDKQKEELYWQDEESEVGEIRQHLIQDCRLAAQTNQLISIHGEEGTNKDEIVEIIHNFRTYNKEVIIHFDCKKIDDEKQANILFGSQSKEGEKGYWDRAGQGTLHIHHAEFLSQESKEILIQIVAKNTKKMPQIILSSCQEQGTQNQDIDHLDEDAEAIIIAAPPLRNCREDISSIAQNYLKELCQKLKLPLAKMDKKFTQVLLVNDWKGNHKELKKFMETALINSPSKNLIVPKSLLASGGIALKKSADSLDSSIKNNIIEALKQTRGKVFGEDGAAVLLGINPSTLQSKIRKFNIKKKSFKRL
jgi:formate hydrogenlyase transcriptional activator